MFKKKATIKQPECEKYWTTLYYGSRGSGKTLHQAKEVLKILNYLKSLYIKNPTLKRSIVFSVQKFSQNVENEFKDFLFYWKNAKELQYCPRKDCWRGKKPHRLHGCYLIFDDIATIFPADSWANTPIWLRKTFSQARHFGIRILANLQDPFSVDINFRRYADMAFKFRKLFGSRDPDETKPPLKYIWGMYQRRKIKAELLWRIGDKPESEIIEIRRKEQEKKLFKFTFPDIWRGSYYWINRTMCEIYDTTQDVPEYKPSGYLHKELKCIDPKHNHDDPTAPNYCNFKKVIHELI